MTAEQDRGRNIPTADLAPAYKRHVQGGYVRSGVSVFMWFSGLLAYQFGIIREDNFIGASFPVIFLILYNLPTLWILKRIRRRTLFRYFSFFIHLLEIVGYTAIMHFLGGIEALYLLPVYTALIIYVGVVAPRRLPFIIAGFCVICFNLMVILEHYGLLRSYKIHPAFQLPWPNQVMIMLVNISLLFVVAFIASYTADRLKKNRNQLGRQNEELREALQKASESDRLKSEFLANMSHELRTPLNAVIGFSELLTQQYPQRLDEEQKEYAQSIHVSGKHLLSIINDILDLSKVEAGKIRMEPTDIHLRTLLDTSLVMFKEKALKHRIRLATELADCPETLRADELRLRQIVYNLLSNAVKFTPDGGAVILSARRLTRISGNWFTQIGQAVSVPVIEGHEPAEGTSMVDIAVADTGIGLKKEDQERIFRPFEQGDGSIRRRYQGTGLGLSLTKRFVELHEGYISVESEGENRGSTFHCLIPVRQG
jgi:signal transduction histidine kinase